MDLNDLFVTLVLVNCLWVLSNRPARLWVIKAVLLLAVLGGVWLWKPERAGQISIGPWALLMFIPAWLQSWTLRLVQQRRLKLARWTCAVLSVLHPSERIRPIRQMIRVSELFFLGQVNEGLALARQLGLEDPGLRSLSEVIRAQLSGQWGEFQRYYQESPAMMSCDSFLLGGAIQSIPFTGNWNELPGLCQWVNQARFHPEQNAGLALRTFAILGDLGTTSNILLSSGHLMAREFREFWTAIAEQLCGQSSSSRQRLLKLVTHSSPVYLAMAEQQLAQPLTGITDADIQRRCLAELQDVRSAIEHDARYAVLSGWSPRWAVMTYLLIAVMLGAYLQEIPGGSEDTANLERLGAMVVPLTGVPGEWKHAFTSGFLHFGPVHLTLNMLGMLFLGQLVERAWGPVRLLIQFLVCIVVSAALLPWLTFLPPGETAVFAGASGGIMGLLGGLWGHLMVGRWRRATPLVSQQFKLACSFIIIQSLCDVMTPQVSMTCHLIGLFTGMVGGVLVACRGGRSGVSGEVYSVTSSSVSAGSISPTEVASCPTLPPHLDACSDCGTPSA